LASTYPRFWRSLTPPRSPTTRFETKAFWGRTALDAPSRNQLP
jgi:hypothetical protein